MAKILIIEDEKILGEMYKEKFLEENFEVDLVFSCEEAINYLKSNKPNLILLDILIPKENGITFLKKIKNLFNIQDIPIIAFSNYDESKTKKEAFALGVRAYLIKTQYTPKQLVEEIKKFLN